MNQLVSLGSGLEDSMMDPMSATTAPPPPQVVIPSMVPTSVNSPSNMTNLYSHGNPGTTAHMNKGVPSNHCAPDQANGMSMSDDSETPISSPDEPSYKIPVTMPQSPSSFKRELMDTSASYQ